MSWSSRLRRDCRGRLDRCTPRAHTPPTGEGAGGSPVTAAPPANPGRISASTRCRTSESFRVPAGSDLTSEVLYQLSYVGERPANPPRVYVERKGSRTVHTAVILRAARTTTARKPGWATTRDSESGPSRPSVEAADARVSRGIAVESGPPSRPGAVRCAAPSHVAIGREAGRTLAGPPPAEAFPELPVSLILDSLQQALAWFATNDREGGQAALAAARALAWAEEGRWLPRRRPAAVCLTSRVTRELVARPRPRR
jgi:hypothetical protein